jgi:hypothetical protein
MMKVSRGFGLTRVVSIAALGLLLAAPALAAKMAPERLCALRFTRMASAQTSRVIKEIVKCVKRHPTTYAADCVPFVNIHDNLDAPEAELAIGLRHVERHGDGKFPRKCKDVSPDFFQPACFDVTDTAAGLRRCLYNNYTTPFVEEFIQNLSAFSDNGECALETVKQFRVTWRNWIDYPSDVPNAGMNRKFKRVLNRMTKKCGSQGAAEFLSTGFGSVQYYTSEIRAVVPFDQRR